MTLLEKIKKVEQTYDIDAKINIVPKKLPPELC